METKECIKCRIQKPLADFFRQHTRKDGRQSCCRLCANAYGKVWREQNKQRLDEWQRAYNQTHREQISQAGKAYYLAHRDVVRQRTREYQVNNKDKIIIYSLRRYNRAKGVRADLTSQQWELIKSIFRGKCAYCGKKTTRLEKEHIIPLSQGGGLTLRNIVPACRSCNSKKGVSPLTIPVKILLF